MRISQVTSYSARVAAALLIPLAFASSAAFADPEFNPAHRARAPQLSGEARVIVKFKSSAAIVQKSALTKKASAAEVLATTTARADALGARLGLKLRAGRALDENTQVVHSSGMSNADLAAMLSGQGDVEYAEPDSRESHLAVPNDPFYNQGPPIVGLTGGPASGQWYLRAPSGETPASINAAGAWDTTTGSPGIVVAVLDTGIRPEHPDLAGQVLPGYDMIADPLMANDGDARDNDATDPGDWITQAESDDSSSQFFACDVAGSSWHGTMTSSLIGAATNNGIGMASVASTSRLLPVRVLGKCGGFTSDITAGIRWAAGLSVPGVPDNPTPARVINLSLGSEGGCSLTYQDAVTAVTTKVNPAVVVAAAGNSTGRTVGRPANCAGVIGVAGLRHVGTKVGFSDLGTQITISAPGGNCVNTMGSLPCLYPILAAKNTGPTGPAESSYSEAFKPSVGTSFSSPLVAGTVALMLSVNPALTPAQVKTALQSSARPFPTTGVDPTVPMCHVPDSTDQLECRCTTFTCGAGMLDAAAAVAAVLPASTVVEFYNTILDNYFITSNAGEATAIDNGSAGPGWTRTGNTFNPGGSAQVCRFYGSISPGPNSHFYTIDPAECDNLKQIQATTPANQKRWNFESLDFSSTPPVNGGCAAGKVPVYRAYNNGFARGVDSNHRITRNFAAILEVVNRGWSNEGVVMCAPQ